MIVCLVTGRPWFRGQQDVLAAERLLAQTELALQANAISSQSRVFRWPVRWPHTRVARLRRLLEGHASPDRNLLLVGHGYGATVLVNAVNRWGRLPEYRSTGLLTLDLIQPPRWLDRNQNKEVIRLQLGLDRVTNFFAVTRTPATGGAILMGPRVVNVPLNDQDHWSLVRAQEVTRELRAMVRVLWTGEGL